MGDALVDLEVDASGFLAADRCDLGRAVLRDPALADELAERGYVVVPFLDATEVGDLRERYLAAAAGPGGVNPDGAYNDTFAEFSVIHSKPEFRRLAYAAITEAFGPHTDALLADYRPLMANFVNKPQGKGVVPAHQNFSVVDESRFQSVSVWVPLVDCTVENGAMWMLDGSHRRLRGRRGMWAYQCFGPVEERLLDGLMRPLEVPAGHAVVLDDALVHYSPPNATGTDRLAIQYVMVPAEADALWFRQVGGSDGVVEAEVLRVDEQYFFDFWHGDGDVRFAEPVGLVDVPVPPLTDASLAALLGLAPPAPADGPDAVGGPAGPTGAEPAAPAPVAPTRAGRLRSLLRRGGRS